jgi:hypothetical protein
MTSPSEANANYITVEQVADRYCTTPRAIHGRTARDDIPFLRRSGFRRLLFSVKDLDTWDNGCELETVLMPDGSKRVRPKAAKAA